MLNMLNSFIEKMQFTDDEGYFSGRGSPLPLDGGEQERISSEAVEEQT